MLKFMSRIKSTLLARSWRKAEWKVRDVQLIRDPQSGRSKGIAYIEFYLPESVFKVRAAPAPQAAQAAVAAGLSRPDCGRSQLQDTGSLSFVLGRTMFIYNV